MFQTHTAATRQELLKLKEKFKSASRGYKLLKDKRDSLIQIFILTFREAVALRKKVDETYFDSRERFKFSMSYMDKEYIDSVAETSDVSMQIESIVKNIMGVKVQELSIDIKGKTANYSNLETNYHFDYSLGLLSKILPDVVSLIAKEYRVRKLAEEIERTRKRVNALEYIILPDLKRQIKYINSKLEELALQNTVRLMRIKKQISVSEETQPQTTAF